MNRKLGRLFIVVVLSLIVVGFYSATNTVQAKGGGKLWESNGNDIYNKNTGNVGIGTNAPTEKLTVDGTVESTSGGFKFPDGTTQTTAASNGDDDDWDVVGTDMYSNANVTGNVGIGTSNPQGKLDINGTLAIGGDTGITGQVLTSQGSSAPIWTNPSLDDFPSRIAGDPGTDSGTWSTPYTDAANATDGDYSTYASGIVSSVSNNPVEGYITWDFGKIIDAGIVTIKADIIDTGFHGRIAIQGSQDNVNWALLYTGNEFMVNPVNWYNKEQTFLLEYRIRYIRIRCQSYSSTGVSEYRIYEIKVR